MTWTRKQLGAYGEQLAEKELAGRGYRIAERNWRCRTGEIDRIAWDGDVLVFVEVRTRRYTGTFGTPEESVDSRKQRQVRETAQVYLHMCRLHDAWVRFDLISVYLDAAGEFLKLNYLENAF
jgi:putative endonuclease